MNWKEISGVADIESIITASYHKPQVIFKHSTRCSISSVVKQRLERAPEKGTIDFYYLDLIQYRDISNLIAERFSIYHESPQILLVKNGECIFDESHNAIHPEDIYLNAQ